MIKTLKQLVSYSDGEGGLAGIGAAIWSDTGGPPLAVYCEVPEVVRGQWRVIAGTEDIHDIYLVEALGPLLLLVTFPKVLRHCLWTHYIDNVAAEASLIRRSASSDLGNHIIGMTGALI